MTLEKIGQFFIDIFMDPESVGIIVVSSAITLVIFIIFAIIVNITDSKHR
jgi:hypothetical protein